MNLTDVYQQLWADKMPDHPPEMQYVARVRWTAELFPGLLAGAQLIDLGTGSGAMLHEAKKRGWKATGYEFNPEICRWLETLGYDVRQADLSIDRLSVENVDVITCCDVIEHLMDPKFAMSQAFKALKPGGWLFVSTPNLSYWRRICSLATGIHPRTSGDDILRDGGHVGYYGALDLAGFLKSAGFADVEVVYRNPDPAPALMAGALQQLGSKPSWYNFAYQIAMARK